MKLFGNKNMQLPKVQLPNVQLPRPTELRLNAALGMAAVLMVVPVAIGCFWAGSHFATRDRVVETKAAQVEVAVGTPTTHEPAVIITEREALGIGIYVVSGGLNKSDYVLTMIGDVIRNRVYSNSYPNTYEDVLTQPAQFGALAKTGCVWPMNATDEQKAKAMSIADKVLDGEQLLPRDCVYVSDTAVGEVVAMLEGLYFGR